MPVTNRFSYSVKFVCGTQPEDLTNPKACFPVRPGSYATEINIYNYHLDQNAEIQKYFVPLVLKGEAIGREPNKVGEMGRDSIELKPQHGTMDDCCRIADRLNLGSPAALTIGFLQIISTIELSVTAVYTASDLKSNSLSIDVDQVQPKAIPLGC